MAISFNQVAVAALARSAKNRPDYLATKATELLSFGSRALTALFALAADVNPWFFAKNLSTPFAVPVNGWARPADAESVLILAHQSAGECDVVPYSDRTIFTGRPRVYRLGGAYVSVGDAVSGSHGVPDPPAAGNMTFTYSRAAVLPTTINDVIDPGYPERFQQLLVEEVAMYLALKDGRQDEVAELRTSRDGWAKLYIAFLEHETVNVQQRHMPQGYVNAAIVKYLAGNDAAAADG